MMLQPLTVDDMAAARYIHASAFERTAAAFYAPEDIAAVGAFVRSPLYSDLLLGNHATAGFIDGEMVGTAVWSPGPVRSPTARILVINVRPLFMGGGIGRRLLDHIDAQSRSAGFSALEVAATLNSAGFFESSGFRLVRKGGWTLPLGHELQVAYMRKAEFKGLGAQ
jgi:N-acetylglutamate synthase-like GNAT family acetyltransferase